MDPQVLLSAMDRAAPRRRAGKSTRGKRAAGYSEPVPAYVEPGSGEAAAYTEWDDQAWSEADYQGIDPQAASQYGEWDDSGWTEQGSGYYAEPPTEPQPAPGGGRRIAGRPAEETPAPTSYRGKRAARTEPDTAAQADPYATGSHATGSHAAGGYASGAYPTGGYPTGAYQTSGYQTGGYQTGGYGTAGYADQSGGWQTETGAYPAPVQTQQALSAPPSSPPPAYPPPSAYPDHPGYPEYPGWSEQQSPAGYLGYPEPQQGSGRYEQMPDESGRLPAYDSGYQEPVPADPYAGGQPEPQRSPRWGASAKAAALLVQPRSRGAGTGVLKGLAPGTLVAIWGSVLALGFVLLGINALGVGPAAIGGLGATVVGTAYTWALTARIGGRPLLFGALAAASGLIVVIAGQPWLCAGAAVLVAAVAAVYAVMTTVPARRFGRSIRETLIAAAIAVGGSFAGLGFEPVISVERYEYATLACAIGFAFFAVYRLGAGLHGLGRRGAIVVGAGGLMLALTLLYAEMLRRYGSSGLTDTMDAIQRWCLAHLRGYPRPIEAFIGVPALAWGVHMRSRRRQGWWVCLFGVALTAPIATTLGDPDVGLVEAGLSLVYSIVVGLILAFIVIRVDVALSSPPATGAGGRRAAREAEDATAVRPEPGRTRPLL